MRDIRIQSPDKKAANKKAAPSKTTHQQDYIGRLKDGKSAWNKWAKALLAKKRALELAGKWDVDRVWDPQSNAILTTSDIPETKAWLERARLDFSNLTFTSKVALYLATQTNPAKIQPLRSNTEIVLDGEHIDFSGYIFPSDVLFNNCQFKTTTLFNEACFIGDAWFEGAKFDKKVNFDKGEFKGDVWFNGAIFSGNTSFQSIYFSMGAWFNQAKFLNKLQFKQCLWSADARFHEANFKGRTLFEDLIFKADLYMPEACVKNRIFFKKIEVQGEASFYEASFSKRFCLENSLFHKPVFFNQCDFNGYTIFHNVRFKEAACFKAIHVAKGFALEKLQFETQVPNFRQAHFVEPAQLKEIEILGPPKRARFSPRIRHVANSLRAENKWLRKLFYIDTVHTDWASKRASYYKHRFINSRRKQADETYYRALERVAKQAGNIGAQKQFIAGQVRARRHVKDKLSQLPSGSTKYLAGVSSEIFSGFGRSLLRPALCWMALFILFTGVYLSQARNPIFEPCGNKNEISPTQAAQSIALTNGLYFGWGRQEKMNTVNRCLYGNAVAKPKKNKDQSRLAILMGPPAKPLPPEPMIPANIARWGALHTGLSLLLMGLFAMNLRTRLRSR